LLWALPLLFTLPGVLPFAVAEAQNIDVSVPRRISMGTMWTRSADRAVLGVVLGAGSAADTSGVRLESVDANGPAAKAGLQAGDVLTEVNGVSLKVAKEDAEDLALTGLAQRRLQRVLAKAKPGDDVRLQYRRGGSTKALSFKTVSAADLERSEVRRVSSAPRMADDMRGRIGVTIGGPGTSRDTLGLFVSAVTAGGPAELAGVFEGERVAAVNGVDVRVPREDIDDEQTRSARIDRFVREVSKVAPGSPVSLRVYGNGKYREVTVKAVKASDLPSSGFSFEFGDRSGDRRVRVVTPPPQELMDGFRDGLREQIQGRLRDLDARTLGPSGTVRVITRRSSTAL
jgi:S1-C subfamily serine protease